MSGHSGLATEVCYGQKRKQNDPFHHLIKPHSYEEALGMLFEPPLHTDARISSLTKP